MQRRQVVHAGAEEAVNLTCMPLISEVWDRFERVLRATLQLMNLGENTVDADLRNAIKKITKAINLVMVWLASPGLSVYST